MSGLTAAQAEELFLLSREVQTLCGKLALDFIELSHSEASFRMGAQATGHENTVEDRPDHSSVRRSDATQPSGRSNLVAHQFFTLSSYSGLPKIHGTAHQLQLLGSYSCIA